MKNRFQIVLLLIIAGIGYGGYEYYDFSHTEVPQMEQERQQLEQTLTQRQSEYNKLKEFATNIEKIKLELRELNLQLESALEHMPRTFNFPGLLRKLTMLAQSSGVELSSFKPAKSEQKGDSFYSTIGIDFDLRGSFTQSLVFFDQVSRLKRIINIDSLKMNVREGPQRSGGVNAETIVALRTYRFVE